MTFVYNLYHKTHHAHLVYNYQPEKISKCIQICALPSSIQFKR